MSETAPKIDREIDIELQLRGLLADRLQSEADRICREPAELLADIIEAVLNENLVNAVLDLD